MSVSLKIHSMEGVGSPVAKQWNVTFSPSCLFWEDGRVIKAGRPIEIRGKGRERKHIVM